jgi:hypothetical protein
MLLINNNKNSLDDVESSKLYDYQAAHNVKNTENEDKTTIPSLTQRFNARFSLNDKKTSKSVNRHSLFLPRPIIRMKQSETQLSLNKISNSPQTNDETVIKQEINTSTEQAKKPSRIIVPWSITNWLNSQRKKSTVKTTSEEMSANAPPSPPKTPEMQKYIKTDSVFECDHDDLEGSENETTSDTDDNLYTHLDLTEYVKAKSIEWKDYPKQLVDTHCHFDMLFKRYNFY